MFDPGLSALGTDDEAGGARAQGAAEPGRGDVGPMPATPPLPRNDPRLPLWVWWSGAGLIAVGLVVAAAFSV